ncbi:MAG: presenilin family intramembrane aspartyl protease [Candidatus Micrarchaeota archaeon]
MSGSIFRFPRIEPVLSIALMFALTQILAVWAGLSLLEAAKSDVNVQLINVAPTGNPADPLNALFFIIYIVVGAGAALFAIRFFKHKLTFRVLEVAVLLGSVSIFFFAVAYPLLGRDFTLSMGAASLLGVLFAASKFLLPSLKNPAAILSSAGVGALFGFSLSFWPALLFVGAISLYDYIAVFRTRHMLVLAQNLGSKDLAFTITAQSQEDNAKEADIKKESSRTESRPRSSISSSPSSIADPYAPASPPVFSSAPPRPAPEKKQASAANMVERLDLGSGDLAIPAMLAVSAYSLAGLPGSIAVAVGSTISLYVLLHFVVKNRVVLPALPPICLGGVLALIVVLVAGA